MPNCVFLVVKAWNEVLSLSVLDIFYESWNKKFLSQFQSRVLKVGMIPKYFKLAV